MDQLLWPSAHRHRYQRQHQRRYTVFLLTCIAMLGSVRSFHPSVGYRNNAILKRFAIQRKQQWATTTTTTTSRFISIDTLPTSPPPSSSSSLPSSTPNDDKLLQTWRDHPEIKKTLRFPTWIVPSSSCQKILRSSAIKPFLGTMESVHPRIRLARTYNSTHQLVLRNPDELELSNEASEVLDSIDGEVREGPVFELPMTHQNWTTSHILHHVLPAKVHPPPTAFEQVGHVAHLNLKANHEPYARLIGDVLLTTNSGIKTVVNKVGEVSGKHRTYDMEVLAGNDDTNVQVTEHGVQLRFNLKDVYWCTRLSGERKYMMNRYFRQGQVIADPFCGVGALCVLAAKKYDCTVYANDWNPNAVASLKENIAKNGVAKKFQQVVCGDAYDFLVDLGLDGKKLPHHIVMNYPLESTRFLPAFRWWALPPHKTDIVTTCHVYLFARAMDDRSVEDVAIDEVAQNLLPEGGACEITTHRKKELDRLGCEVESRVIRDVAPGKVVVCVSFVVSRRLLRNMQGDFV